MSQRLDGIGLGILSWRGYPSLREMLRGMVDNGMLELFAERVIFFPEIDDEARDIAVEVFFSMSCWRWLRTRPQSAW